MAVKFVSKIPDGPENTGFGREDTYNSDITIAFIVYWLLLAVSSAKHLIIIVKLIYLINPH